MEKLTQSNAILSQKLKLRLLMLQEDSVRWNGIIGSHFDILSTLQIARALVTIPHAYKNL